MKTISLSIIRKVSAVSLVFYILIFYGLIIIFPNINTILSDWLSLLGDGISLFIIGFFIYWQGTGHRTEWKLFALGISLNFAGDLAWSIYEVLLHQEVPNPSVCDIFYLSGSICYFFAFIYYIKEEKLFDILRMGFDILITMVVSATIIFKYILLPISNDVSLTFTQKIISLAYPIFDIGYLGGVFSLVFFCAPKIKFNRSNLLISVAFLIWFFSDQLYLILSSYTYVSGSLIDPFWPVGCWVLALASLYPSYHESDENNTNPIAKSKRQLLFLDYIGFLLPYVSVTFIVILVSFQYIFKDPLIAGTVITVLLILLRQIFSLLENKRLILLIQQSNQILEESKLELEGKNKNLQQLNYLKEQEANTDFLTGIFNRRYINELLQSFPNEKAIHEEMSICVLLIDIDYFKQINDQWGHEMGDIVLRQVALLIKKAIRSEDIAGRFGGDEFIVILPNTDLQYAKFVAETLLQNISIENYTENGEFLKVNLSIGCAKWRGFVSDFNINAIIANADTALYQAKAKGRNQYIAVEF